MRIEVVTRNRMISLGILAKNLFIEGVLDLDEDGKSFDALQTVKNDTLERIKRLPLEGGFTQRIKDGAILAFGDMKAGEKFLCINAWVINYESDEAKLYWKVQELVNQGYTLQEAIALGNEQLKGHGAINKLEYLYGVKSACWKHLNYIEALKLKNELANQVLSRINNSHYIYRDDMQKKEVMRAIRYNLKRIEE